MKDVQIKERIKYVVESQPKKIKDVAKAIGITSAYLSSLITGKQGVSALVYKGLHDFGVNINWLISGEGQPWREDYDAMLLQVTQELQLHKDWLQDKDELIRFYRQENESLKNERPRGILSK
mgnify:CR=1 FL=1|tara:strand:+ start:294 stop:659 length:366 start_codon:yes stop_codon:yes gene_type:complete